MTAKEEEVVSKVFEISGTTLDAMQSFGVVTKMSTWRWGNAPFTSKVYYNNFVPDLKLEMNDTNYIPSPGELMSKKEYRATKAVFKRSGFSLKTMQNFGVVESLSS